MRNNNHEEESISSLKTDVAVLKTELEHLKQRAGFVQAITFALIMGAFGWFGRYVVGSP